MEVDEEDLRMLLGSHGNATYGHSILTAIRRGDILLIHRVDGTPATLTEPYMAKRILCDVFGWRDPSVGRHHPTSENVPGDWLSS